MTDLVYPPIIAVLAQPSCCGDSNSPSWIAENVPTSGGAVIASNHVSYLDFIFVGLGADKSKRLVRFMAKDSVFPEQGVRAVDARNAPHSG